MAKDDREEYEKIPLERYRTERAFHPTQLDLDSAIRTWIRSRLLYRSDPGLIGLEGDLREAKRGDKREIRGIEGK